MGLVQVVRFITTHPLNRRHKARAVARFLRWQIATRLRPGPRVVPFAGRARLRVHRGMAGATGNIYCGLHEFEDMALVCHALRPTDTFVDVGANIGSYTVLAAAVAGARAIAFEPVPATFAHLQDNIRLNALDARVQAHNTAVGREPGTVRFTSGFDTVNHVASPTEQQAAAGALATIQVPVVPLDQFAPDLAPALIKIDVEGFETDVIAGARRLLQSDTLQAVLMELNGSGARYGYEDAALHRTMLDLNFKPHQYAPFERELREIPGINTAGGNTIYVRNAEQLRARLKSAPPLSVLGTEL
jgi:FkbM family methyltransferase